MKNKLTNEELFYFCEQMGILLHSGISSTEGLHILCEDSQSPRSKEIFAALYKGLEETGSLAQALKNTGLFPSSLTAYVKTGEETGCLDEVMESLAHHYEQEEEIASQIHSAVTYPLLMLGMMGAVIVILLVKVLPVFQQVFRQMGMEISGISEKMLQVGTAMSRYSAALLVFAALLILCLLFLFFRPAGRRLLAGFTLHIPVLRDIPVCMDYSRLSQGIALGLRSGLDPDSSLELSRELVSNPIVRERLKKACTLLKEGRVFSDALTQSGLYDGINARLLSVGFHSGAADNVLEKLAQRYRDNAVSLISRAVSVVEPTIVIVLSLLVGLVLLSVMMPLLGILSEMMI